MFQIQIWRHWGMRGENNNFIQCYFWSPNGSSFTSDSPFFKLDHASWSKYWNECWRTGKNPKTFFQFIHPFVWVPHSHSMGISLFCLWPTWSKCLRTSRNNTSIPFKRGRLKGENCSDDDDKACSIENDKNNAHSSCLGKDAFIKGSIPKWNIFPGSLSVSSNFSAQEARQMWTWDHLLPI